MQNFCLAVFDFSTDFSVLEFLSFDRYKLFPDHMFSQLTSIGGSSDSLLLESSHPQKFFKSRTRRLSVILQVHSNLIV